MKEFVEINSFARNEKLKTNYINAYSFKEFPFYGMAFHPEAVIYSWVEKNDSTNGYWSTFFTQNE